MFDVFEIVSRLNARMQNFHPSKKAIYEKFKKGQRYLVDHEYDTMIQ